MERTRAPDKGEAPEAIGNSYKAKEFVRTTRVDKSRPADRLRALDWCGPAVDIRSATKGLTSVSTPVEQIATLTALSGVYFAPMSAIGDKYLLGSGRSDHDRLRVISEIHDGRTRELLRKAGFVGRHRFVEFGCGLGYVTRWAASEGAHATGIDLNVVNLRAATELADQAGLKTAEFRSANIYEAGLKADSVDVLLAVANGPSERAGRRDAGHPCGSEA